MTEPKIWTKHNTPIDRVQMEMLAKGARQKYIYYIYAYGKIWKFMERNTRIWN